MASMNGHHGTVELQQMRYVVAVAEERSFTRAARRCHVVQSALSHQIKSLERQLGVELFARSSRRVEVTPAGDAFVTAARESLAAAERAMSAATAADGHVTGRLTVGLIPTVTVLDVPALLGTFHRRHPAVRIGLRHGGSDEFVAAIVDGTLDVAVLGLPESIVPSGVRSRVLARQQLVAVVPEDHALAARTGLQLRDLEHEEFVDFPEDSPGRTQTDLAFRAAGLDRSVTFEVPSTELMLALVRQGLGVTMLAPDLVPTHAGFVALPVTDGPSRVEYLAWSAFNASPAAIALLDLADVEPEGGTDRAVLRGSTPPPGCPDRTSDRSAGTAAR